MDSRKLRFWRWFRAIPLTLAVLVGVASLAVTVVPGSLFRSLLFPVSYREAILESAWRHGVDPRLACAVIQCESGWDEDAESDVGAQGLMQVMPSTAETLAGMGYVDGYSYDAYDLLDPVTNIEYGIACLDYLDDYLDETDQVIAAYNAGLGTVQDWMEGGLPDLSGAITYPETRLYLFKVSESYAAYQRLYDTELDPA